jgi:hypothetical protein
VTTPMETYAEKLSAVAAIAEEVDGMVGQITAAARILEHWKTMRFPGMPNMSMARALSATAPMLGEWVTWPEVVRKVHDYHEALAAVDQPYELIPSEHRVGAVPPPAR